MRDRAHTHNWNLRRTVAGPDSTVRTWNGGNVDARSTMAQLSPRNEQDSPHRVLVVDRHEPSVRALAVAITASEHELVLAAHAGSTDEAYSHVVREAPEAVILDVSSRLDTDAITRMKRFAPRTAILAVGAPSNPAEIVALLSAGADGVLSHSATPDMIVDALHEIVHGRPILDPGIGAVVASFAVRAARDAATDGRMLQRLTPREREALDLLVEGATNREIAAGLQITRRGVERHLANAYVKLGVHNRIEAGQTYQRLLKADELV